MTELKPYLFSIMTKQEKELAITAFQALLVARGYETTTSTDTSSNEATSTNEESNFFSDLSDSLCLGFASEKKGKILMI